MTLPPFSIAMRLACAAATAAATPGSAFAQGCASVEVHNLRPKQGHLMVAAYADAESYGKQPVTSLRLAVTGATMSFQLCGLAGESVALMLFQDLDSDGKMNRNLMGIPNEPWGSSGNPGMLGPQWETGRVALDGRTISVRMAQ